MPLSDVLRSPLLSESFSPCLVLINFVGLADWCEFLTPRAEFEGMGRRIMGFEVRCEGLPVAEEVGE